MVNLKINILKKSMQMKNSNFIYLGRYSSILSALFANIPNIHIKINR